MPAIVTHGDEEPLSPVVSDLNALGHCMPIESHYIDPERPISTPQHELERNMPYSSTEEAGRAHSPTSRHDRSRSSTSHSTPLPTYQRPSISNESGHDGNADWPLPQRQPSQQRSMHSDESSFELQSNLTKSKLNLHREDSRAQLIEGRHQRTATSSSPGARRLSSRARIQSEQRRRLTWITVATIILGLISTLLSGIFLCVAFYGPHYGHVISSTGKLNASTAAFLTTLLARLTEITFITSMLAVIGQELSRRAYGKSKWGGVSLSEVSMRSWIVQPGTLISRYETVRHAGLSMLGIASLIAAILAILYAPAATALVQPQLKFTNWARRMMSVPVSTSFANPKYISDNCKTPVTTLFDASYSGSTCVAIAQAAAGYHNLYTYMGQWSGFRNATDTPSNSRPNGTALLFENIIVNATWIERIDMGAVHSKTNLIIDNVTLAAPHVAVAIAAHSKINDILQPSDLDGLGSYEIQAGVPSPALNVLCATLGQDDLKPFVYELWPDATTPVNMTTWPRQIAAADWYLNGTKLDDVFEWGTKYGKVKAPPIFPMLPMDFNIITNFTSDLVWGRDSIYFLAKAPPKDINNATAIGEGKDYSMCRLRVSQTPKCSTVFSAAASTNTISAYCEDSSDDLAYSNFKDNNTVVDASTSGLLDWPNVAFPWGTAVALNEGITDGNASIARILTQFILRKPALLPNLPSFAEAMAVLAVDTLLTSTIDAPVVDFWNLTTEPPNIITNSVLQNFTAKVRVQEYASGGTATYHRAFFPVLLITFILNVLALLYFAAHRHWLVDLTEPITLFGLAVAPPIGKNMAHYSNAERPDDDKDDRWEPENRKDWSTTAHSRDYTTPYTIKEDMTGVTIEKVTRSHRPRTSINPITTGLKRRFKNSKDFARRRSSNLATTAMERRRSNFQKIKEESAAESQR